MTKEILFKAQRADGKGWVEGYINYDWDSSNNLKLCIQHSISNTSFTKSIITPETVCQYTGLLDKNGVKIFEGDNVKFYTNSNSRKGIIETVEFVDGRLLPFYDDTYIQDEQGDWFIRDKGFEVIGNIHDRK